MAALLLSGCESPAPKPAPVVDRVPETARKPQRKPGGVDTRPEYYTVKRGDTLYGIALDQGLDYRELAAWNGLTEMNRITIGQQLRLRPPGAASPTPAGAAPADAAEVVTAPLPAPMSSTFEAASRGRRARASSTSSSVSGRGISTSGVTSNFREKNS
jgi:lipoprotein NlpD